ncbi:hypothetical protein VHEMI04336 [[Torrubiella] hemipterigena]|uniref:tripeptidyl-peptidase II n=1 Tax=[Torrubiella] hemipterigena TaxID=1531966 RepID=A0A0A1SV01_9HYPO|nr:hypothetical protein VHEMI04336 [[Torrubiella] hemipterigena]
MAFFLSIFLGSLAAASPLGALVVKQSLPGVPDGWHRQASAPADHGLDLHIRLREENLDVLQQRLLEISDPKHANYGKHLSKGDVDALTAPKKDNVDSVTSWLKANGLDVGEAKSGYLQVTVSVDQAKKLLNADYAVYKHAATGREVVRTTSYSLPQNLHDAITMVQPSTLFSTMGRSTKDFLGIERYVKENSAGGSFVGPASCADGADTQCLRDNYNIKGYTAASNATMLGIAGFLEEVPNPADLSRYLTKFDPNLPSNITVPLVRINNGSTSPGGMGEADLDVQIAVPITYPIKTTFYSTGGRPPIIHDGINDNEPYLEALTYLNGLEHPPQTWSISYGDNETSIPSEYMDAVCSQFLKLGARGVSVLVSAGDDGAGTVNGCTGSKVYSFDPAFPASCPWVTVVGGTAYFGAAEQAHPLGGSGFSNHFTAPAYQEDAVNDYIDSLNGQWEGIYKPNGRAYPDVAALFEPYPIFYKGNPDSSGGTSASAPTVASVVALLNDYLVSNGRAPLGFLNPWLYSIGKDGFTDIKTGSSNVCVRRHVRPTRYGQPAFPATEGWDAATGWGVPNFGKLLELVNETH